MIEWYWILLGIYLYFLPITYALPLYWLEKKYFHNTYKGVDAELIVILGTGLTNSSSMMQPNLTIHSLENVRFGAFLQRETNLPILLSGHGFNNHKSEAEVMKKVLEEEFSASVKFVEKRSNTTMENAKFTAKILEEQKIKSVFLVSNSPHLRRATYLFEKYAPNVKVTPLTDFKYASKKFNFDISDFKFSLATPFYQKRFYLELLRYGVLRVFSK